MLFIVQFRDNPEMRHLRPKLLSAHLEFLQKNDARVRVAGSLREDGDDRAVGGLWIVDAKSFEAVKALYSEDPFWTGGLRASVEVHRYAKAFPAVEKNV
jgi:uncharacterized protein